MLGYPMPLSNQSDFQLAWVASTTNRLSVIAMIQRSDREDPEPVEIFNDSHVGDRTTEVLTVQTGGGVLWGISATIASGVKRGQAYVAISVGAFGKFVALARGYVYDGHGIQDGEFVEPGPGGGEGYLNELTLIATAVSAGGLAAITVPTNAIYKIHTIQLLYTCTSTVGSRIVEVGVARGGTARHIYDFIRTGPTVSQTSRYYFAFGGLQSQTTNQRVGSSNITAAEGFFPEYLIESDTVQVDDQANVDALDTVTVVSSWIEEWLVI